MSENLDNLRHSCAHLLAAAVMKLWPDTKRTIGPAIENGFYFDFEFSKPISEEDLPKIEKTMREILKSWNGFERHELSTEEAKKEYPYNEYKDELIDEFSSKGEKLTFYKSGDYWDLCRGGHCEHPDQELKHFKLLSLAGAYWRGDEKNTMLTRIYGTCFPTKEELDKYLWQLEEAKKRDHKRLGRELELFMFHESSPGMPYWLPKGVLLYNELISFWRREHIRRGYQEIVSPVLNKKELYVISGHFDHYWDEMFIAKTNDEGEYGVKAMNCPNAHVVYGSKPRSYRDLPLRLSDTDPLHRYERSGTLNGLLRVREFRQDDAHIYVQEEQIEDEYNNVFEIVRLFYSIFNISYSFRLGTRNPENFMGDVATWDRAEKTLRKILDESGVEYSILDSDAAFYGPKVDILMKDALGREWQMGTIQLDFQQPRNFGLTYIASDGSEKTPIAIHRVIYGSLERFIGILIEHYAGAFPTWISPVQAIILPVSEKFNTQADLVIGQLHTAGIRTEVNQDSKTLGAKIRQATLQKIPYMCIIGEKEVASDDEPKVSVRARNGSDLGSMTVSNFVTHIRQDIEKKR